MANSTTAGRRAQDGCYLIESQSDAETHSGSHINSSCNSPRASYCEDDGNDVERLYPQLSDGEVQDIIANKRFMLINVWRNIDRGRAVRRFPLACLDASTVNDEDIFDWVPPRSNFPVYDGFAAHPDNFVAGQLCLEANERHRWFYFPELTFSEALLFKTFDSAAATVGREKLARACFHTAFQDPATETHDPDRQSCEARLLVLLRSE
eukprot:TRINITY_DN4332_c0_g1_i2.p1 TRINITY_DN4332_c0_g1~~TRINITY_DN4332_c0_g1_i2.p1  ORF type:complete len:233 (+),score=31.62 TRINITY_DN4332_c0_g1_i2:77-700(+)